MKATPGKQTIPVLHVQSHVEQLIPLASPYRMIHSASLWKSLIMQRTNFLTVPSSRKLDAVVASKIRTDDLMDS
jgi:hypothetical protein